MNAVDDEAFEEGFEQAYRAVKGAGQLFIPFPRERSLIPGSSKILPFMIRALSWRCGCKQGHSPGRRNKHEQDRKNAGTGRFTAVKTAQSKPATHVVKTINKPK
jgi:hypothetical protein